MNTRLLSFSLAGALLASAAVNLRLMQGPGPRCPLCAPPSSAEVQSCIECLALTPEQHAALLQECSSCCGGTSDVETRIAELRTELRSALRRAPVDVEAVRALGRELAELRGEAIVAGVEAALRVRSLLTPEQLATLEDTLGKTECR